MPPAHPRDLGRGSTVLDPGGPDDHVNAVVVETAQREDLETSELAALHGPLEHRGLTSRDHHAHVGSECRQQLLTQPRIGDPKHLVGIDHHHHAATAG